MKLTINGKEYGLQWGMGALEIYMDTMGFTAVADALDTVMMPNKDQDRATLNLFMGALQNYAEINELPFDLTYRKLQAWLDESDEGTVQAISKDFFQSKYLGRTMYDHFGIVETPSTEPEKKKVNSRSGKSLKSVTKSVSNPGK